MRLVIVESPTKAKTLKKILPADYVILPSYGHIADLPKSALGVDLDNDYQPEYIITANGKKAMPAIKREAKKADDIFLAVDPDREGEAIAYSILRRLPKKPVVRVTFHEITKQAVLDAFANPGKLNMSLVEAQQARRVLDRLVGYKLSPLLWKKIRYGLSAGRVQSVAVRLIVERQEAIDAFQPEEHWRLFGEFLLGKSKALAELAKFPLTLLPKPRNSQELPKNEQEAELLKKEVLQVSEWKISDIKEREKQRRPYPPFRTSTLQQASAGSFGWSAKKTMSVAQKLYEQGLISYMRTDSANLSPQFLAKAKKILQKEGLALPKPRFFAKKVKKAQEAHEAIRPTNPEVTVDQLTKLPADQKKLYRLIWERSLASQAKPAYIKTKTILISSADKKFVFKASASFISQQGWLKLLGSKKQQLPTKPVFPATVAVGDAVLLNNVSSEQHFTSPPPYFNEASLVKELENLGVGRPSTYASIIETILRRGYVDRDGRKLVPTDSGKVVAKFLKNYFPNIVDYQFTAKMEDDLDRVALGELPWVKVIDDFYQPFAKELVLRDKQVKKEDLVVLKKLDRQCPRCGKNLIVKLGKYGSFISCSAYPDCQYAENINKDDEGEVDQEQLKGKCPQCGGALKLKTGRFGKFIGCENYPKCKFTKPYLDKIGMTCPECGKGEVVKRMGKRRQIFYACSRYPDCKYTSRKNPKQTT